MAETVVLSGSSLNTYLRCARQWELAYVQRMNRPPSLKMALGTAGHWAAEVDLRPKIETREDLPLDVVLDAFRDSFVKETVDSPEVPDKKETRPLMLDSGIEAMKVWHGQVAPTIQPIMIEEPVQFMLTVSSRQGETNIPWTGTVDCVDEGIIVRDWKFVGKKPDPRSGDYILNMVGYTIGYRELTGGLENGFVLDHVVRTKTPYHFPVIQEGPVPDESIMSFAGIAESVYNSIGAGSFPPTGLKSGACSWCGYKRECGYYQGPK